MARALAALIVLAGALVALAAGAGPAGACSCAASTTAEDLARADVVFVGTVEGSQRVDVPQELFVVTEVAEATTFRVQRVFAGDAAPRLTVLHELDSAGCGITFRGARHLVFATRTPDGLITSLCTGTRSIETGADAPEELGQGAVPTTSAPPTSGGAGPAPASGPTATDGASGAGVALALGLAAAVLGLAGVVVVVRRRHSVPPCGEPAAEAPPDGT
ncbi:hypothetical protein PO878_14985 [Iamia majanohamensis]|uniref:Tissue inhibitor of metalloproteinase n=1 Tax=Iamia majanohamensis TaxID=467976 RepID=A0AAE9Y5I0_9ACTN|nr:hypothetical protein [Iamia majanohamensis]WCO65806.1 hypothetical protein PO878_14985 [Iamia majanohamensis]